MLVGKGASEVGDVERDVEVTSALLNVEKKKRLKASGSVSLSLLLQDSHER